MKTKTTNRPINTHRSSFILMCIFPILVLVFALLLFISCANNSSKNEMTLNSNVSEQVHVAFAGGGWRAHTGHSAWTISLLEKGTKKLKDVFSNVGSISSNSGGSWYSTMLMFSDDFVSDIEAKDALDTWTTDGWIGKQKTRFDEAPCDHKVEGIYLECVIDYYTNKSYTGGTYWKLMVEKLVYKDYSLDSTSLDGKRQPWAADKPLLLASSLLNNSVVLNKESDNEGNHRYYQACFSPSRPVLDGDATAGCSNGNGLPPDVTPVTFTSIPKWFDIQPISFFTRNRDRYQVI